MFGVQELELRFTSYLQRGAAVEAEFLTAITSFLPEDVQQQFPPQLKDILMRGSTNKRVPESLPTVEEAQAIPIATVAQNQTGRLPYKQAFGISGARRACALYFISRASELWLKAA